VKKTETDDNLLHHTRELARWELIALLSGLCILAAPFVYLTFHTRPVSTNQENGQEFVGRDSCRDCHKGIYSKWQNSDHDKAMDEATDKTVLGDFNQTVYTDPHNQVTSTFYRRDRKYYVETEGPDGDLGEFEITHTFGVYPLQQYLVPFPDGRLQCLNVAWDVEKKSWYRLPPYEVKGPTDWLHWTKGGQGWNGMCAECHSTRLVKGYNHETDSYQTNWFEIDVGCEACHGPGSKHVSWAEQPTFARTEIANYGLAVQTENLSPEKQIAICAPCHARRFQLGDNRHEEGQLLDKMVPSLLDEGLYHPDGQVLEEVYVYGSFTQSKMYMHGVRCSDCHDSHSLQPHKEKNELCLQCHRGEVYDNASHHFHKKVHEGKPSDGALCVKCHMPGQLYMGIDYRPDHSIRIPRPDLSLELGTPNSCSTSDCHGDKPLKWVVDNYAKWYGASRKPHYGTVIAAGRAHVPEADRELATTSLDVLLPPIVRATALSLLGDYPGPQNLSVFRQALEDENDLIRYTAIRNLDRLDPPNKSKLISPKLYDPVKAVRMEAAVQLSSVARELIREADLATFEKNIKEYRQAMLYNSDFAPQRYNLGNLEINLGNTEKAVAYYRQSIAIDSQFFPAKVNLAMHYNRIGENGKAEGLLREVVAQQPGLYEASYSLGLLLAETKKYEEAAEFLGKAADGMPSFSRARYNQALALLKIKRWEEGEKYLLQALLSEPANTEYFVTLVNLYLSFRQTEKARNVAQTILEKVPDHKQAGDLLKMLE
jgi:tetratricopeptide (TPR) repeat protein